MSICIVYLKNCIYQVIKILRRLFYFTLIVESKENATWLLLESAYPIGDLAEKWSRPNT